MKTLIALSAALLMTGCSTLVNDRLQPVSFTSPEPVAFTVTSKEGRTVSGFTPKMLTLDSAVGAFECERYTVKYAGKTRVIETTIQPEFWGGAILIDGGLVDMIGGNMCKLPEKVAL